jgi:hypothetical protein
MGASLGGLSWPMRILPHMEHWSWYQGLNKRFGTSLEYSSNTTNQHCKDNNNTSDNVIMMATPPLYLAQMPPARVIKSSSQYHLLGHSGKCYCLYGNGLA